MVQSSAYNTGIKCREVIAECEKHFGFDKGEITLKTKQRNYTRARHVTAYLCRKITGRSYPEIARALGYKDHTTVLYACQRAQETLKDTRWEYAAKLVEDAFNA